MFRLALATLRYRTGGVTASFVAVFLGATILMGYAALLDTALGASGENRKTLITIASVVGGWGLILIVFAVTSTVTLSVRQRGPEMALLKNVGATPAQIARMIVGETITVALAGAMLAILPAALAGRLLLTMLARTHQVGPGVVYRFGPTALSLGLGITLAAATIAALLAATRITRMRAAESAVAVSVGRARMSTLQIAFAGFFLTGGLGLGILTAASHGRGYKTMQTAGPACVLAAIGLALLGPALIRAITAVLAGPLERATGVSGYLTVLNARQRTGQLANAVMPIILFTAIAAGTLSMQNIENRATAAAGLAKSADLKSIQTLNLVVVGMIALFAAIMLTNTLVAATAHRKREFAQQRLIGATPAQVLALVSVEAIVLTATGVLFGTIASALTVVPYSIARTHKILPETTIGIYLAVAAIAAAITLAATLGTARRTIRASAVQAAAT
jgi:putative ABC transport system permease protein